MNIFNDFVNEFRDVIQSNEEIQHRKNMIGMCEIGKTACVVVAVSIVALSALAIFSGSLLEILGSAAFAGIGLPAAHDVYKFFANVQEMQEDAFSELESSLTNTSLKRQLTKGMIFSHQIVEGFIDSRIK